MVTHQVKRGVKAGQQHSRQQSFSCESAHLEKMLLPQEQTVFKDRNIKSKQPFPSPTSNTPVSAGRESSIKAKTITKRSYNPFYHSVRKTATVIDFTTSHGGYNLREYCDW